MNRTLLGLLLLLVGAIALFAFAYGISPDLASRWIIEGSDGDTAIAVPKHAWGTNGFTLFIGFASTTIGSVLVAERLRPPAS